MWVKEISGFQGTWSQWEDYYPCLDVRFASLNYCTADRFGEESEVELLDLGYSDGLLYEILKNKQRMTCKLVKNKGLAA